MEEMKNRIQAFQQQYQEPVNMVHDGIRVARVTETFKKDIIKMEWSIGTMGTAYHTMALDFGKFLVMLCEGEMKVGAAPKTSSERYLSS